MKTSRTKKCLAVLLMLAMMISPLSGIGSREVSAEEYTTIAVPLAMNGQWSSDYWMTDTNKEDWYKLTVPQDGKVTIKVMAYMSWLKLQFYNQDLSMTICDDAPLYNGSEIAPSTKTYEYTLSAGTYYIKMSQSLGCTGKYKLCVASQGYGVTDQGADAYDSPLDLPMGNEKIGAITETDTEDWYRLIVPTSGYYTVKIYSYMSGLNYKLYNEDLSKEISGEKIDGKETVPTTETYDYTLTAGTYYIRMSQYYSWRTGKYTLSWSALTPATCTHDYKTSYVSATYTRAGYTLHTCQKCGHAYKDSYVSKKKLGTPSLYGTLKRGSAKMYWYSVTDASGYEIRYSTKSNFKKSTRKITVKGRLKVKRTIKGLKRRKRYYFQIRAYKNVGNRKIYSAWSVKKTGRTL